VTKSHFPSSVRDAIRALLDDTIYRANMQALRSGIDQMPTPDEIVPVLERLSDR
jgi:UDP:flavonoid glycosyltransferase YjiC (YdhE family)